jgi:hypothetical protein
VASIWDLIPRVALAAGVAVGRANIEAIQAILEAAGIEFLNGDARGVRLRAKKRKPANCGGLRSHD